MDDQELTGQGAGVEQGQVTTGAPPLGAVVGDGVTVPPTASEPGQTIAGAQEAPPAPERRVELTELAEFRSWQAARDKREAQLQQQLQTEQDQRVEMQRQIAELQLRDADPEQVAAYYQQQLQEMQQGQVEQQQIAEERAEIVRQGEEMLKSLGLPADTEGLEWSEEPTWSGLARLATSAARVMALQRQAVVNTSATVGQEAAQAARVEALRAAGVTRTTAAVGGAGAPAPDNPIEEVDDPNALLEMGFQAAREKRRGSKR